MEKPARKTTPLFHAVIAAAGSGSRAGTDIPKQYKEIGQKPVLRRTLETFLSCPGLRGLAVVINPDHRALYDTAVAGLSLPSPVAGGNSRKDSVYNGLSSLTAAAPHDPVLIHDAARPFVTRDEIEALAAAIATGHPAATLAVPVADSLRRGGQTVPRDDLWAVQTPQAFTFHVIMDSHRRAAPDAAWTDDASLATAAGYDVALVTGRRMNFKITTADDWELADIIIKGTP